MHRCRASILERFYGKSSSIYADISRSAVVQGRYIITLQRQGGVIGAASVHRGWQQPDQVVGRQSPRSRACCG